MFFKHFDWMRTSEASPHLYLSLRVFSQGLQSLLKQSLLLHQVRVERLHRAERLSVGRQFSLQLPHLEEHHQSINTAASVIVLNRLYCTVVAIETVAALAL